MSHKNTRALITGGSQGLGFAIAQKLIDEGASQVIITGRDIEKGERSAKLLGASFLPVDLSDMQSVKNMFAKSNTQMGGVNVLVNSAADCRRGSILDTEMDDFDTLMNINVKAPYVLMQAVANAAIARNESANILNILSMVVHCGQSFLSGYSASKAALANITKNSALTLRHHKIRVNGINCGWMNTEGEAQTQAKFHNAGEDWLTKASASQPFGQLVEPASVAELASVLLSPNSGVMTGSIIDFDQHIAGAYPE